MAGDWVIENHVFTNAESDFGSKNDHFLHSLNNSSTSYFQGSQISFQAHLLDCREELSVSGHSDQVDIPKIPSDHSVLQPVIPGILASLG